MTGFHILKGLQKCNYHVKAWTWVLFVGGESSVTLIWLTRSKRCEGPECLFSLNNLFSLLVSISPYGFTWVKTFFPRMQVGQISRSGATPGEPIKPFLFVCQFYCQIFTARPGLKCLWKTDKSTVTTRRKKSVRINALWYLGWSRNKC